jgi:hypothetical protein
LNISDCGLNQYHGHWLLYDALHAIITMILKLNKEYEISYSMDNLMDDDFVIVLELSLFASNTKNNNI